MARTEAWLSSSYSIWKIISVLLAFIGFTVMFGFADNLLTFPLMITT
ncbi:MAG: hypothetical protein U0520_00900 [Candidatus Saccharimonadales bacterium]